MTARQPESVRLPGRRCRATVPANRGGSVRRTVLPPRAFGFASKMPAGLVPLPHDAGPLRPHEGAAIPFRAIPVVGLPAAAPFALILIIRVVRLRAGICFGVV